MKNQQNRMMFIALTMSVSFSALITASVPAFAADQRMDARPLVTADRHIDVRSVDARGRAMPLERLTPAERESVEGLKRAIGGWVTGSPQGRIRIDCVSGRCTIIITWGKNNQG